MEGDEDMSTTIEPTVRVETRRQPLPPLPSARWCKGSWRIGVTGMGEVHSGGSNRSNAGQDQGDLLPT